MRHFLFRVKRRLLAGLGSAWRLLRNLFKSSYTIRLEAELKRFHNDSDVHALPPIFHYWSQKYLAPLFNRFGISDPEHFFFLYAMRYCQQHTSEPVRIISIGCGNCDMEARLARRLCDEGITHFSIECQDINAAMLQRGAAFALSLGVESHIVPTKGDFNNWSPTGKYDIVMANQCLHHVVELEKLFAAIKGALKSDGLFLVSDMIGRNGHQRWPEALQLVAEFWREMPARYKYNRLLKRFEPTYINHDCSREGFEGIRAQDILPLLNTSFHFELFIPFANIIAVFIDRPFGHNFEAEGEWDQGFIDRVHARDEAAILSGQIKPTQMLAVLRNEQVETRLINPVLTPEFCVRESGRLQ